MDGPLGCALARGQLNYGKRWTDEEIKGQAYDGPKRHWATWKARQFLSLPNRSESFRNDVQVWRLGSRLESAASKREFSLCPIFDPAIMI